jgi:hypothetical protein
MNKNIIFLVGYAGSGKSFLSNQYKNKGYTIISTDEIIRKQLMKDPNDTIHFLIYSSKSNTVLESKKKFVKIMKQIIKTTNKVVIEGQLNVELINDIIGKKEFDIILVKPSNKKIWKEHIIKRFIDDPANYGRIGWIRKYDEEINKAGLNDYIKNGINGKIITKIINKVVKTKFIKHEETEVYYKEHFKNLTIFNTLK